jgi:hypothetical protein
LRLFSHRAPGRRPLHLLEARKRLEVGLPKISYTKGENLHVTLNSRRRRPKRVGAIKESLAMIKPRAIELRATASTASPTAAGADRRRGAGRHAAAAAGAGRIDRAALQVLGFEKEQRAYRRT